MQILGNFGQPRATQGNPGVRKNKNPGNERPETGDRKPKTKTGNRNPQIKENKFSKDEKIILHRFFLQKNKTPIKKDLKLNLFQKTNSPSILHIKANFIPPVNNKLILDALRVLGIILRRS